MIKFMKKSNNCAHFFHIRDYCAHFFKVMKITLFLFLLGIGSVFADSSYSQNTKLSLHLEDGTIRQVFDEIQRQSEFIIFYKDNQVDLDRKINVRVDNSTVNRILDQALEGTNLTYHILDRQIVIVPKRKIKEEGELVHESQDSPPVEILIRGKVTDTSGHSLPGVTIVLKGTTNGTITDEYGNYTFKVPVNAILAFSFVGMKKQEIPVNKQSTINVILEEEEKGLDEVVVVGYGTQKKGSVIGSVDRIEPGELKQPTRTISTSLAGRLSGVISVQSSGEPGYDGATFWIRGVNTFTGTQTPLILVDGVERDLDNVDPEEIADFTILKDATATAVYGVRGANGVVLITTKKGTISAPKINFKVETGLTSPLKLPDFVDGATYMESQNEALENDGQMRLYSQREIDNTRAGTDPYYYPDVDWIDDLMKNVSVSERVNLNVSGGSERVQYFISGSFLNQNGIFKSFNLYNYDNNINVKRYNFRSNVDVKLTKTTLMSVQLSSILQDGHYPATSTSTIFSDILQCPPVVWPLQYPDKTKIPGYASGTSPANPFQKLAASGYTDEYKTYSQSNISAVQDLDFITKGLKAKFTFAFDTYTYGRVTMSMSPRPYLIAPTGYDDEGNPVLTDDEGNYNYVDQDPSNNDYHSYLSRTRDTPTTTRTVYLEGSLQYNRTYGKHDVGALFLFNRNNEIFPSESDLYESVPKRYQGLTGRTTYSYDHKYFLEFNFGYNGSENFAKNHRYGFFPAVAVGWVPTEERFMSSVKPVIDYLKIRLSYGQVGNDQIGSVAGVDRFAYLTRVEGTDTNVGFGANNGYGYGAGSGVNITYYGNLDATWETANKTDLGLEMRFANGIGLQADFFYEKRTDIWTQVTKVPDLYGYGGNEPGANVGKMKNKGVDGYIDYQKAINKNFSLNIKGTFTFAKNEVLANGAEIPAYDYQSQIGQPYGRSLGYVAKGLFIDNAEIENSPDQSYLGGVQPGDIKYEDVNKDGVINAFDRIYLGYPNIPEITYGFGANIFYKNFDFSFLLQGAAMVSFFASPKTFEETERGNVWSFIENNHWTKENQDVHAKIPRLGTGTQTNNYENSTFWLRSGRYLRLKQLEIGYSLPKDFLKSKFIQNARFYLNGVNLLTWSPFDWWDPESQNSTGLYYPPERVINLGLEINF